MDPLQKIQEDIAKLQADLQALNGEYYNNNFTAHQDFNKYSNFTTNLKVPHYATLPSICQVGEIVESSGKLYICSSTNTWTVVGTQS